MESPNTSPQAVELNSQASLNFKAIYSANNFVYTQLHRAYTYLSIPIYFLLFCTSLIFSIAIPSPSFHASLLSSLAMFFLYYHLLCACNLIRQILQGQKRKCLACFPNSDFNSNLFANYFWFLAN